MDTEKSSEVLDALSDTPLQQETEMEKVVASKLETPEESTEPEKPPATVEVTEQLAVNGHDAEQSLTDVKETTQQMETEIVTEPVKLSEEVATEDILSKEVEVSEQEKCPENSPEKKQESEETETLSGGVEKQPELVGSPEKVSDPFNTEPENIQLEQQPAPENAPEPLPLHEPLADSAPEPEPEKLVESVPEAELPEQTLPEPVTLQQSVDVQPPSQAETAPEQVETGEQLQAAMEAQAEVVKEVVAEKVVVAESREEVEAEKPTEIEMEKAAATEVVMEMAEEKQTEPVELKEEEKPTEIKPAADVKQVEPEKPAEEGTGKEAEPLVEGEGDKPEQENAELGKEEDKVPAPGSLSFALLEQEQTKGVLRTSRTLVVLKGLPGSGKSILARAIADSYKDLCLVVCADDHGVKPENPEASADGYKALDEAVVAVCSAGTSASVLIVVDDTNHTQDRLARLGEIAEQHQLVVIFLEPRTEWNRDLPQLSKKTRRGLKEAQIQAMKDPFEEMSIPLYFGWFLLPTIQDKVRCTSMDFLKTLDTLEAFKKHLSDFTGGTEKEVDLEQYFHAKRNLHCTTKYCDYGRSDGAKEYAERQAVQELYGSVFELSLTALFVTPRTVGARVSLTEEQLVLWPADAEKEAEAAVPGAASLPLGSRAHVTLGCAEGVEPVQTGPDLLEILVLQHEGQQGELVEEMELGSLAYYGKGRWLLSLREPICVQACFSSFYKSKKPDLTKKEVEKKKKPKCTIL